MFWSLYQSLKYPLYVMLKHVNIGHAISPFVCLTSKHKIVVMLAQNSMLTDGMNLSLTAGNVYSESIWKWVHTPKYILCFTGLPWFFIIVYYWVLLMYIRGKKIHCIIFIQHRAKNALWRTAMYFSISKRRVDQRKEIDFFGTQHKLMTMCLSSGSSVCVVIHVNNQSISKTMPI